MASPLNRLQTTFRTGTQLGRTSLEEASARAGQTVRPTTPVGAAEMGVGPDSAKMAGSSANIAAAQRQALQPSETERLQDVLRRRTLAREETKEERAARGRAAQLGGLTSLQSRVQELMAKQFEDAAAQEAARTPDNAKLATQTNLTGEPLSNLQSILIRYGKGEATNQDLRDAATLLGLTTDDDVGAKLNSLMKDTTTEIAEGTAGAVGDRLLVTEDALSQMGYTAEGIGSLLGITPGEVLDLTTDELVGQINVLQNKEFSRVNSLRRIVNDPNVGAAERQAAQEQLVSLGYAGVSATESSVEKLTNEIENANTIEIAGRVVTVEEALSDKFISGLVKAYLDNPVGETAEDLRNSYPGLVSFIEENKESLKAMTDAMDESITAFTNIQSEVKALGVSASGTNINSTYLPPSDEFYTDTPPVSDVVTYANENDTDGTVTTAMNNIAAVSQDGADSLMAASDSELLSSGFYDNPQTYSDYVQTITSVESAGTTEGVLDSIFGDFSPSDIKNLEAEIAAARQYMAAGLLTDIDPIIDLLDSNKDGKIDDAESLKRAFISQYTDNGKPISISELVKRGQGVSDLDMNTVRNGLLNARRTVAGEPGSLIQKFGKMFQDGELDKDELATLEGSDISIEDLQALADSGLKTGLSSVKEILDKKVTKEVDNITGGAITNINDTINTASLYNKSPDAIYEKQGELLASLMEIQTAYTSATSPAVKAKIKEKFDATKARIEKALIGPAANSMNGAIDVVTKKQNGATGGRLGDDFFRQKYTSEEAQYQRMRKILVTFPSELLGGERVRSAAKDYLRAYNRKKAAEEELKNIKI